MKLVILLLGKASIFRILELVASFEGRAALLISTNETPLSDADPRPRYGFVSLLPETASHVRWFLFRYAYS